MRYRDITWTEINEWFDTFYKECIEGRKPFRGVTFSGARIEIYGRDDIAIVLLDPFLRGSTPEDKAVDFVKGVFGVNHQSLFAEVKYERFVRIISGEEPLVDDDWVWPDE